MCAQSAQGFGCRFMVFNQAAKVGIFYGTPGLNSAKLVVLQWKLLLDDA